MGQVETEAAALRGEQLMPENIHHRRDREERMSTMSIEQAAVAMTVKEVYGAVVQALDTLKEEGAIDPTCHDIAVQYIRKSQQWAMRGNVRVKEGMNT